MRNLTDSSRRIRLASIAIIGLFIILGAAAYYSGWQVKRDSEFVAKDAVPGTIAAHKMRMAMSRSIGWVMVAAFAQTTESRDASLKTVHEADVDFANEVEQYKTTIKIDPAKDEALLADVTNQYAKFQQQRLVYEKLVLAGERDKSATFLENELVPAYVAAINSAQGLLDYNHANSVTYADHIRNSVNLLYWAVAVVMVLGLVSAAVLIVNLSIRRRESRELRESEELFRTSFESATVGVCLVGTDGRFRKVNRTLCNMLGYAEDELLQLTFNEVTQEEDREIGQKFIDEALSGGPKTMRMEKRYLRKDGQVVWAYLSTALIEKEHGNDGYMISYVQDITERKRATEQLEMLKTSIDKHFDGAYWMDTDNRFIYVNDSACKALGYTQEELLGQPVTLIAPHVTPQSLQEVWKSLRTTGAFARESKHRRKDGSEFPVELVASYVRFEGKEFNCSFARDITERKRAEAEMIWKTAFLEAQVDSALDGILVVDENAKRILQNQRLFHLFNVPEDIAKDTDDARLLHHVARQTKNPRQFSERVAQLYANRSEIGRDEIELEDGTILDRYSASVYDKAGKYYGRIWTFRDITDHRKVEEQFRQAQKMEAIGTLAGGIAHDFNNILAAVNGYTEMARRKVTGNPVVERYLDAVLQGGGRATTLVRQILTFSRQQEQQRVPVALREVVEEPLKLLRATIPSTIEFDISLANDLPNVLADTTQIHQIVMNLCTNASHAMKNRPGRLGVRLEIFIVDGAMVEIYPGLKPGPHLRLSISDTGHGMDRATLARIFEPFFTTKKQGEGTGLGLSVVHGIMQSHGGAITVYSQPGEGTVFHLYFPVFAGKAEETKTETKEIPAGHGQRILFVDDEQPLALLGQSMLEDLGYVVECKTNVGEALAMVQANPTGFDLVISDLTMPGMLGTDFAGEVLRVRPGMPFILTTGYAPNLTDQSVHELGVCELLHKPHTLQSLGVAVHRALAGLSKS